MVVTMKKLQILLPAAAREQFLEKLAKVGVVHIEESEDEHRSVDLEEIETKLKSYRTVLGQLEKLPQEDTSAPAETSLKAEEVVARFNELEVKRDTILQKIGGVQKDIAILAPWGDFDPAIIEKLESATVKVRFFEVSEKQFSQLELENVSYAVISSGTTVKFMVFERDEVLDIKADEVSLPFKSISALKMEVASLEEEVSVVEKRLKALAPNAVVLKETIAAIAVEESFEKARLNFEEGAEGAVLFLSGWFPVRKEKAVNDFLAKQTVWFEIRNPNMEEEPPIHLKNSAYAAKFEPITGMFALPSYSEIDPTPFFAPFFMFFYGMCLGDIGYGLIVFIAALGLFFKGPVKMRSISILGIFLGLSTLLNGVFLNSFFGEALFNKTGVSGLAGTRSVLPFLGSNVIDGKAEFPAMTFSIYIGAVQMLLGMFLQTVNRFRQSGFVYAIQPFCYIPITLASFIFLCKVDFLAMGSYAINSLRVGEAISSIPNSVLYTLLGIGIVPFVFFNTPSMKFYLRPVKFLWDFYNFINSVVSYGLSYLRLFALGLAGGLLGNAFNQIALMIITDGSGHVNPQTPAIVFTVLIMVAGHLLNFGLSALGAFVHTVRLTFVEFYGSLSFDGGGKPYIPFTGKTTNI
jgi:V/A-type H+/Na+-transporting ATPase subunit I